MFLNMRNTADYVGISDGQQTELGTENYIVSQGRSGDTEIGNREPSIIALALQ